MIDYSAVQFSKGELDYLLSVHSGWMNSGSVRDYDLFPTETGEQVFSFTNLDGWAFLMVHKFEHRFAFINEHGGLIRVCATLPEFFESCVPEPTKEVA